MKACTNLLQFVCTDLPFGQLAQCMVETCSLLKAKIEDIPGGAESIDMRLEVRPV